MNFLSPRSISRGDAPDALRVLAARLHFRFLLLAAAAADPVCRDYRVLAYPTTYLINGAGSIVYRRAAHAARVLHAALANQGFSAWRLRLQIRLSGPR